MQQQSPKMTGGEQIEGGISEAWPTRSGHGGWEAGSCKQKPRLVSKANTTVLPFPGETSWGGIIQNSNKNLWARQGKKEGGLEIGKVS